MCVLSTHHFLDPLLSGSYMLSYFILTPIPIYFTFEETVATELGSGTDGILTQICINKVHFLPILCSIVWATHSIIALYSFYIILYFILCAYVSSAQWHLLHWWVGTMYYMCV